MPFQKRPARHVYRHRLGIKRNLARPQHVVAAEGQVKFGQVRVVPNGSTVGYQITENAREELVQDLRAARQQDMKVATLRYPSSGSGIVGQHVALDHCDGPEEISQHPRGKQPAHARPKNNRVLTQFQHGKSPSELAESQGHRLAFASALIISASKPAAAALARWRSMKFR